MATQPRIPINEFVKKLRANPALAEFTDVSDADLLKEVFRVQPEAAKRLSKATSPKKPSAVTDITKQFFLGPSSEFKRAVGTGVIGTVRGLASIPGEVYSSLTTPPTRQDKAELTPRGITEPGPVQMMTKRLFAEPLVDLATKAEETSGTESAAYRALSGMPIAGPAIAGIAEKLAEKPGEALGEAAVFAVLPKAFKETKSGLTSGYATTKNWFTRTSRQKALDLERFNVEVTKKGLQPVKLDDLKAAHQTSKAIGPSERTPEYVTTAESAIREAAQDKGFKVSDLGLPGLRVATESAVKRVGDVHSQFIQAVPGTAVVDGGPATVALAKAIPGWLQRGHMNQVEATLKELGIPFTKKKGQITLSQPKTYTVPQAARELTELRRRIQSFSKEELASKKALITAYRTQLNETFISTVERFTGHKGLFRETRHTYGALEELLDGIPQASEMFAREGAAGFMSRIRGYEAGRLVGHPKYGALHELGRELLAPYKGGDALVRKAFEHFEKNPVRSTPGFVVPPGPVAPGPPTAYVHGKGLPPGGGPGELSPGSPSQPPSPPTAPFNVPPGGGSAPSSNIPPQSSPPSGAVGTPPTVSPTPIPMPVSFLDTLSQRFFKKPSAKLTPKQTEVLQKAVPDEASLTEARDIWYPDPEKLFEHGPVGKPSAKLRMSQKVIEDFVKTGEAPAEYVEFLKTLRVGEYMSPQRRQAARVAELKRAKQPLEMELEGGARVERVTKQAMEQATPEELVSKNEQMRKIVEEADELTGQKPDTPYTDAELGQRFSVITDEVMSNPDLQAAIFKKISGKDFLPILIGVFGVEGTREILSSFRPTKRDKKMEAFE